MTNKYLLGWVLTAMLLLPTQRIYAQSDDKKLTAELSGSFTGEYRYFPKESLYPGQRQEYWSTVFKPELYLEWNEGKQLLQFNGFARLDQWDTKRTHWDIRELYWQKVFKKWELSVGLRKIFWGVTESNHLVDVINQVDALEGFSLEEKLGQPMVHVSWAPKWGTLDFFVMPYHRQMEFPGPAGRLRPPFNLGDATYESEMEEFNPDLAVRWSHYFGPLDIGVSHFYGTTRLPLFTTNNGVDFFPYYELMHQTGIDLQVSTGSMLWKAEGIRRQSKRRTINAFVVGGEYTLSNIFRSGIDIGLLAEYTYDDRGIEAVNALTNDIFLGSRIAFNDRQSSDILGGIILDFDNSTLRYFMEANRRLGNSWKFTLEASGFANVSDQEFLYLLRNDGFVQAGLAKYF